MNQQKRINKIIEAVEVRIQDEVGGLLGVDFKLNSGDRISVSKEGAFNRLQGKQICAQMDISGDITGKGCLLIGIKDAIRLGGTLIMLPASELEEVCGREEYNDEIEDSYGEIANIIAGSFTKDFEEMYPKSCRFVRKEQEVLFPAKVEVDSDSPVGNQMYYQVFSSMTLDGRQMGDLVMLLPAVAFGLEEGEEVGDANILSDELDAVVKDEVLEETSEFHSAMEEAGAEGQDLEQPNNPNVGPKFDAVKHKKKINRILAECQERMKTELAALLGVDVTLGDAEDRILNKEEFFLDHVVGRQVIADVEVVGEIQGKSYLAFSVKDAIHLGGVLIMLPPSELEKVVQEEDFGDDSRDAFGEIANIISGVYTAVFEEHYRPKLRFIRKEFQDIIPGKVDVASDEPLPNKKFYTSSISMAVEGKQLSQMHMLIPADMLNLDAPQKENDSSALSKTGQDAPLPSGRLSSENEQSIDPNTSDKAENGGFVMESQLDVTKHKKLVDTILANCRDKVAEEVSALLGTDAKFGNLENFIVSKEDFFFDEVSGKQVIANLDVVGDLEGRGYLSIRLRDAIRIGGTLIMLPNSELESVVEEEEFGEDTQDAYGEIANIISGVYSAAFEEKYTKRIRFVKTDLQQVAPMKVDIDADEPISDQDYYLSRMDMTLGDHALGKVNLLLPAQIFQLSGLRPGSAINEEESTASREDVPANLETTVQKDDQKIERSELQSLDILVVGDDEAEAARISDVLGHSGYVVKTLSFKDNLYNYIPGTLKAIYLVMEDVDEQAFGVAIKVSTACSVPIVAAGPGWTRTKVIKAVKYGVRDILLTPASEEEIQESVNNNLLELAA